MSDDVLRWIKQYSPMSHVTKDDPPIFLQYGGKVPPVLGTKQDDPTHSAVMGLKLREKCKEVGVECILVCPGHTGPNYKNTNVFSIGRLRK